MDATASPLSDFLEREFEKLAARTGQRYATNREQAAFFDNMNASRLSRLRHGHDRLTETQARKLAEAFDPENSEELFQLLLEAADATARRREVGFVDTLQAAREFFDHLSRPGALLCVEYRDRPRADPAGKHSEFSTIAAKAITSGLHFAMFFPFGMPKGSKEGPRVEPTHRKLIRDHIWHLRKVVREAYRSMRDQAIGVSGDREIAKRIRLYEFTGPAFIGSGIQSRIFYAEIPGDDNKPVDRQVWEWVAGSRMDVFIERDIQTTTAEHYSEQFFPVPDYFLRHKRSRLPQDHTDLGEALEEAQAADEADGDGEDEGAVACPWRVYDDTPPGKPPSTGKHAPAGNKRK